MSLRTLRLPSSIRLDANGASIVPTPAGRIDISPAAGQNVNIDDDILFTLGTDDDQVLLNRSTSLAANTALTGVLVGTPVVDIISANSLILSNITADGDMVFAGQTGGNSQEWLRYDASLRAVVINEGSGDVDFRIESDTIANMFVIDAGSSIAALGGGVSANYLFAVGGNGAADFSLGVGTSAGAALLVRPSSISGTTGNLYNIHSGSITLSPSGAATTGAALAIEAPGKGGVGSFTNMATLYVTGVPVGGTNNYALWVDDGLSRLDGNVFINDTANANMTLGLTVNQGANDNQLIAGKSSDVAHGLTSAGTVAAETDDYFSVQKFSALLGGTLLASFAEDPAGVQVAMAIDAFGGQAAVAPSTTNENLIIIRAAEHDGLNALVNAPANSQIFGIQRRVLGAWNNAFIVDAEGDLFVDGSITITAFDQWDDVALVRAFDRDRTPDQLIRSAWDDHVRYGRKDLQRAGVLSTPSDEGRPMVNVTQLQRLHNGALWQLGVQVKELQAQNALLERKLALLQAGR